MRRLALGHVEHHPLVAGRLAGVVLHHDQVDGDPDLRSVPPLALHLEVPDGSIALEQARHLLSLVLTPELAGVLPVGHECLG